MPQRSLPQAQRSRIGCIDIATGMPISTDELRTFLVLAAELHFGRTAARLHLSPARVSRRIAGLEARVGGRLFDRTSRVVALTPVGRALRDRLQPAYEEMIFALEDARTEVRSGQATLAIGFTRTTYGQPLRRLVRAFRAGNPDCRVTFHEIDTFGPHYDELRRGEIDVLVDWLLVDESDIAVGPVIDHQRRVLAVSTDHPLAGRDSVTVEDLADWDHAAHLTMPTALLEGFLPPVTPSGRPIRRSVQVDGLTTLIAYVANGWVVHATVEALSRQVSRDDIVMIPIHDLPPLPLGLVRRTASRNPHVRALAAAARTLRVPEPAA
jgi:DNA-binding transcriptional LysR family regulator